MQAYPYNRGAKDLPVLEEGDTVRMKPFRLGQKTRQRGTVTTRLDERSYEVDTPTGTYRRNRVHLRKSNNPPDAETSESPDLDQADDQVRPPTPPATPRPTNPPSPLRRESARKIKTCQSGNQHACQDHLSTCLITNFQKSDSKSDNAKMMK